MKLASRPGKTCGWLLCAALLTTPRARAEEPTREAGHPLLRNHPPREYQAYYTTYTAAQDAQGVMYVGTRAAVLVHDGATWRKIPVGRPRSETKGLAVEPGTGTIFVGATEELGYLKTVPGGEQVFVSLLDQLPADARQFEDINEAFSTDEGIYFVAEKQVMRWHDGRFRVWKLPGEYLLHSMYAAGRLYVHTRELGLLRLEGETFVPASADPVFHQTSVRTVTANGDGSLLVGTGGAGLFELRDGAATPLTGEVNEFFKARHISRGQRLRDGSLLISTPSDGIVLLDRNLRFRDHWDEESGVQGQRIFEMFEDREGGLWLCLDAGITRIEVPSFLSVFDADNGLKNRTVYGAARLGDTLFVATTKGLCRISKADPATLRPARCEPVPGTDGYFVGFCAVDQGLLVGTFHGILLLDAAGRLTPVRSAVQAAYSMCRSRRNPARVFIGTVNGLFSLRWDAGAAQWVDEGAIAGVDDEVRSVAEDARGILWAGTFNRGLLRLQFAPAANAERPAATVSSFLQQPGPLSGQPWAQVIRRGDGELVVMTKAGLYHFDAKGETLEPATEYGAAFADGSFQIDNYAENYAPGSGDALWLVGHGRRGAAPEEEAGLVVPARAGAASVFRALPARVVDKVGRVECIVPEGDGIVWVAGPGGMVRLDSRQWLAASPPPFSTLLRLASATPGDDRNDRSQPILDAALPYTRNSVHFDYAANNFLPGPGLRYQTRLTGFKEGKWSDFNERASTDFTNLPEGHYTFEVHARDADGRLGSVASLPFRILPPWQRTPAAYAAYILALVLAVAGLVRWRGRRLRRRNVALESLVNARTSELRGREAELLRSRDDAESANRAKSAFLANMSHELRTPLNAILGYSQVLLKNTTFDGRSREQIGVIGQSGNHLLAMINEVLDLSKVEAGKLTLVPSDFSLGQLLDDVAATFRPRLAEKGLEFRQERAPDLPAVVRADVGRLRQVLFNLLSNAVKFTRRGAVRLTVKPTGGGRVRFEIGDTGIGIAADQLDAIFEAFHQATGSDLAAQGTGLGLAISQRLVGLMGGRIQVESTSGEGSRFWFELPLLSDGLPGTMTAREQPDAAAGIITGYQGAVRRLLLVDDERENRRVLRDLLQPLGFEIEEAADGAQCLEECARRLPDAVLLDLRLGQRPDGFEVARTLCERAQGKPLGIIAVSASVFESNRQQAIDAGCDDFLPKPFEEAQLLTVLGRVLGLRWVHTGGEIPVVATDPMAPSDAALPSAEIDAMLELSLRGDIVGLRHRLDELRTPEAPAGSQALAHLVEPLIASFQVEQLHARLVQLKAHANV